MGKKYILAEKPAVAKKIAEVYKSKTCDGYYEIEPCPTFPEGAYIGFAIGHLVSTLSFEEIDEKMSVWSLDTLPFFPERYDLKVIKGKEKAFNNIKKLVNSPEVTELIIATDAAREGELIGVRIFQKAGVYGKKPIKRLWVSSMTAQTFKQGFNKLRDFKTDTINYYYEAHARNISDYLVGLNLTRAISVHLRAKGMSNTGSLYSIGRVQTPVLKIIVDREYEIENFKSVPFWTINAQFKIGNKKYQGKWYKHSNDETIDSFNEKQAAELIVNRLYGQPATVKKVEKERKVIAPPKLHSLSSLQTLAGARFKYSPSEVLEYAQSLYTKGYISYPRTDSTAITKEELQNFPTIFIKLSNIDTYEELLPAPIESDNLSKRFVDPSRVSDHYALIPTEDVPDISKLTVDEARIYDIVVRSLIAAHYDDAVFDHTIITTEVQGETFNTKGKALVNEGWRKVIYPNGKEEAAEDDTKGEDALIPVLEENEQGTAEKLELKEGKTKPKPRLSSSNLINVMKYPARFLNGEDIFSSESEGEIASLAIGTEATRAGIIDTLIKREYVEVKKNKVFATEKGKLLIYAIGENSILTSPVMTAKWESVLAKIGKGQSDYRVFIQKAQELTTDTLKKFEVQSEKWDIAERVKRLNEKNVVCECPACQGNVFEYAKGYGCENKAKCGFSLAKSICKKTISKAQVKKIAKNGATDLIKGFVSQKGNKFDAMLRWEKDDKQIKFAFEEKPKAKKLELICPYCQSKLIEHDKFIGCSGYKDGCTLILFKESFGVKLLDSHFNQLLTNKETDVISGMKGKKGTFKGILYLDDATKKMKLRFVN